MAISRTLLPAHPMEKSNWGGGLPQQKVYLVLGKEGQQLITKAGTIFKI